MRGRSHAYNRDGMLPAKGQTVLMPGLASPSMEGGLGGGLWLCIATAVVVYDGQRCCGPGCQTWSLTSTQEIDTIMALAVRSSCL